jgi:hypothetical protein
LNFAGVISRRRSRLCGGFRRATGLAKLHFEGHNPFNDRNWAFFLSQHKLESLKLDQVDLNSEVSCRAVATAEVRCLTLQRCPLEDEGAALVESISQGRGPKELCVDSSQPVLPFINALRGNTSLERLELLYIDEHQETRALAAALHENKGLVHLTAHFNGDSDWTELLESISLHPSLRYLNLNMHHGRPIDPMKRLEVTKVFANMLSVNERVEEIRFHDDTFDKDDWHTNVSPRLECNLYRKRFPSIQKIEVAFTRAAVLARALAKFASKPHLVLMLLNQNHDIVSSFRDLTLTLDNQFSIPSRKRSRLPSSDAR